MKVHLIKQTTIEEYIKLNAASRIPFTEWINILNKADWNEPADIKLSYRTADLLGKSCNRVVFNIGGNNFRMICKYYFGKKHVHLYICWIGLHSDYDRLNKGQQQYVINIY